MGSLGAIGPLVPGAVMSAMACKIDAREKLNAGSLRNIGAVKGKSQRRGKNRGNFRPLIINCWLRYSPYLLRNTIMSFILKVKR